MSGRGRIVPTLPFKGVDVMSVYNQLKDGHLSKETIGSLRIDRKKNEGKRIDIFQRVGTSPEDPIYSYGDRTGSFQRVATTNSDIFIKARDRGTLEGGKCLWCRREFDTEPVGIPTKIEQKDGKTIIYTDGICCSFECALAIIAKENSGSFSSRNPHYADSEQILRMMFSKCYPDESRLNKAKDWRLLDINGGPLSESEFLDSHHEYYRLHHQICLPIKTPHIQITIKK